MSVVPLKKQVREEISTNSELICKSECEHHSCQIINNYIGGLRHSFDLTEKAVSAVKKRIHGILKDYNMQLHHPILKKLIDKEFDSVFFGDDDEGGHRYCKGDVHVHHLEEGKK